MGAVAFAKTGTAPESTAWSWDASAQNKILGDPPNWGKYKQAHAWVEGDDADTKAGFKLPHHRMGDSGLEAVWHGVSNAMARLSQADIPDGDVKAVFDHLASHYAQWEKEPPKYDRFLRERAAWKRKRAIRVRNLPMVTTRAPIVMNGRQAGMPTDDDMSLINRFARSPLSASDCYIWPNEISNQNVDAYYTRMTDDSIDRFAAAANRGVAVCDSHDHMRLPMGRSFYGEAVSTMHDQTPMMATYALGYMLRGMQLSSGMSSNDVIRGIEGGVYNDVSVGFVPDHFWCSICNNDMLAGSDCFHWPGQSYEIRGQGMQLCIADVDADLAEFSLVYEGATPDASVLNNAMVLKARHEIELGRATARQLTLVEDRCRVKLFDRFSGFSPASHSSEDDMRGSEAIALVMSRAGKTVSAATRDKLQAMHDKLSAGHDTMGDAMREMADFIAESDTSEGDYSGSPKSAGRAKTAQHKAAANGDNPPPDDEDGNGQADDAQADKEKDGEGVDGEDKEDAQPPKTKSKRAGVTPPSKPGTDDGDGDDDEPEDVEEDTSKGDYDGSPKSGGKKVASGRSAGTLSPHDRAMIVLGERLRTQALDEALQAGARALGNAFNGDQYRKLLERAGYEELIRFRDDWQAVAKAALSPIGSFHADRNAPGGGYWDDQPTGVGARNTAARDPNNPVSAPNTRRRVGGAGADPADLYRVASKRR